MVCKTSAAFDRRRWLLAAAASAALPGSALLGGRGALPSFEILTPGQPDPVILVEGWVLRLSDLSGNAVS